MPLEIVFLEPQNWRPLKPGLTSLINPYCRLHGLCLGQTKQHLKLNSKTLQLGIALISTSRQHFFPVTCCEGISL